MARADKAAMLAALPAQAGEDPFVVAMGGFYRRWFNLVDDLQPILDTVATLKATEDEDWVPAWSAVAGGYEAEAAAALARGDRAEVRRLFLQAKSYYSTIGNLYLALESGPPTGRVARVYADDGHIAARNEREWAPAAWRWLRQVLGP
jgi:hypothetical protein